ncbi:MAG: hypothetical protein OEX13_16935, partial [Gammaproteobacteria bacterium]|nr:hypothetical protein [Gammaproteobacteria bacterium]
MRLRVLAGGMWLLATLAACAEDPGPANGAVPVAIERTADGYRLMRGGEPFEIRGAGLEFGDVAAFARHGGNAFRTWRTDNGVASGREVLDKALAEGVVVAMCIEIGRERHGFDYDDESAVAGQLAYARQEVLKYKDHPALLAWIIGNEPNLDYTNPGVFDAINDISRMIHEIDGKHPTTTALAGFGKDLWDVIRTRASDLDFLSIQMYGDLVNLPEYLAEAAFEGPLFVTEWGAIGHWEMPATPWGAPVEQHSSAKADNYLRSYQQVIEPLGDQVIGSFVFLWGQKQERTPTWYGMFTETGEETETVDVMHYIWNGSWPDNRSPRLDGMLLDGRNAFQGVKLLAGARYGAKVDATDPDGDPLEYRWEVKPESDASQTGGDFEPEIGSL